MYPVLFFFAVVSPVPLMLLQTTFKRQLLVYFYPVELFLHVHVTLSIWLRAQCGQDYFYSRSVKLGLVYFQQSLIAIMTLHNANLYQCVYLNPAYKGSVRFLHGGFSA